MYMGIHKLVLRLHWLLYRIVPILYSNIVRVGEMGHGSVKKVEYCVATAMLFCLYLLVQG